MTPIAAYFLFTANENESVIARDRKRESLIERARRLAASLMPTSRRHGANAA
jgi:hypothetical protein